MRRALAFLILVSLCAPGCMSGPRLLESSHGQYNEALRRTTDQQLLLNLVRLRYRDNPQFLELASVSTQWDVSAGAGIDQNYDLDRHQTGGTASASVGISESPTITYTPLHGQDFAQRLLSPIEVETIALVSSSAWSVERVLRVCVQSLNGVGNARSAAGPTPRIAPPYEEFAEAVHLLRELQLQGELHFARESVETAVTPPLPPGAVNVVGALEAGYGVGPDEGRLVLSRAEPALFLRLAPGESSAQEDRMRELLRLAPHRSSYGLSAGRAPARGVHDSVSIETRSVLGSLYFLSHGIRVPEEHLENGLCTRTRTASGEPFDWAPVLDGLFTVHARFLPPPGAAVSVRYRGYHYYIADDDLSSKTTFSLLAQLVALQSGNPRGSAPVLTLGVD